MKEDRVPRIAVITVGRSPRTDVLSELVRQLGPVQCDEFAIFDDVSNATLADHAPREGERVLFLGLGNRNYILLSANFVEEHAARMVARVDPLAYDLIVIAATGLFAPLSARTPIVHGQRAVDAWISALVGGNLTIGLIYPLAQQGDQLATFEHATQLRSAHAGLRRGFSEKLSDAAAGAAPADLIVMHAVGYTEEMAQLVARETARPVVTARRIIAAAVQLRLSEIAGRSIGGTVDGYTGLELLKRLPEAEAKLTPREQEVLAQALEGGSNKAIGRALKISYRTVEIHRGRAMAKLGAASVPELIRRALMNGRGYSHGGTVDT